MAVYNLCRDSLKSLISVNDLTFNYCANYCGILLVDGKYLSVKGYEKQIPVIYCIDYLSHDILSFVLAPSENYHACSSLFSFLKLINYPLKVMISDDNENIINACRSYFPESHTQLCILHFVEKIKRDLNVRSNNKYEFFVSEIENILYLSQSKVVFNKKLFVLFNKYKNSHIRLKYLSEISKREKELTAHFEADKCPRTNNLIEGYNQQLEGRLNNIRGFNSFNHAKLWINGYMIRRRLKVMTDCCRKFNNLNGRCSLSLTLKDNISLPKLF